MLRELCIERGISLYCKNLVISNIVKSNFNFNLVLKEKGLNNKKGFKDERGKTRNQK
jgi:hypothetical protein